MVSAVETYLDLLARCCAERIPLNIHSGTPEQTLSSIEMLYRCATHDIHIFSRRLRKDLFGSESLLSALQDALKSGCRIHILTKEPIEADHPMLTILGQNRSLVSLRESPREEVRQCRCNFTVVDQGAFRLSMEAKLVRDAIDYWAVTNFNDQETALKLLALFERASEGAFEPLRLARLDSHSSGAGAP